MNLEEKLKEVEKLENELVFKVFDSTAALKLGMILIEKGKNLKDGITIDISKNGHQLFHYSFNGTSPDNDVWVKRKSNIVYRFFQSSLRMGLSLKLANQSIESRYLVPLKEYAPYAGSFPITIVNVGVVGSIAVSGIMGEYDDHDIIVEAIKEYLNQE